LTKKRKTKSKRKREELAGEIIFVIIVLVLAVHYLGDMGGFRGNFGKLSDIRDLGDGAAYFHFIDVGQGDSALITTDGGAVVIDVGSVSEGERVAEYINTYTQSVDYLILTHPHEDHMGSADKILKYTDVKNVIMPAAASDAAFFSRFLEMVEKKEVNVIEAVPGDVYTVGELTLTILAPLEREYDNVNNYSVVTRVEVGDTSALFTGDAEAEVEDALLAAYGGELDCDLLKAGHHGSGTSSTWDFLLATAPTAAVISCGRGNSYGHPHGEVLADLEELGVEVFRTDLSGDLIFVSDGSGVSLYE